MRHFHCFYREQQPIPGSGTPAVRYPCCEWRAPALDPANAQQHPLNRYVCSWLTSDMAEPSRCDEVLQAMDELQAHTREKWFADGDAFCVDLSANGVQFNQSNVGPEDTAWWNLEQARFDLTQVREMVEIWRGFLKQT